MIETTIKYLRRTAIQNGTRTFVFSVFCLSLIFSCSSTEQQVTTTKISPEDLPDQNQPRPNNPKPRKLWLEQLFSMPFFYGFRGSLATVNSLPSNYHFKMVPKATIFADYNSGKQKDIFLSVHFPFDAADNLPTAIKQELKNRNLWSKDTLQIAWVVQFLDYLGGNSDNGVTNITYIKAHGWADPDAPMNFAGDRIKRSFLYGLFDSDIDISYEVKNDTMLPFAIHTHDGMFSPRTAAVRLPNPNVKSFSLWSLVIDHHPPAGSARAIVTLHWLISAQDQIAFEKESLYDGPAIRGEGRIILKFPGDINFATFGDYVAMIQTKSFLKESTLVKKLETLTQ